MDRNPEGEIALVLVEFLQVAVTSIVFLKGIYPSDAFERRRYMNLVLHRARHPQLNRYIHDTLTALLPYIQQGLVERVAVVFFDNDDIPVERFMFKININRSYGGVTMEDAHLDFSLRSFLIKLSLSPPLSKPISQDWRWEITSYFTSLPHPGTSKDADIWIPTVTRHWQQPPLITPIKSIKSEPLSVQLYLEHPCLLEPGPS